MKKKLKRCQRIVVGRRPHRTCKRKATYFGTEGDFCAWHVPGSLYARVHGVG